MNGMKDNQNHSSLLKLIHLFDCALVQLMIFQCTSEDSDCAKDATGTILFKGLNTNRYE